MTVIVSNDCHTNRSVFPWVWLVDSWFLAENDRLSPLVAVVTQWPNMTVTMTHMYYQMTMTIRFNNDCHNAWSISPQLWLVGILFLDKNVRLDLLLTVVTQWLIMTLTMTPISYQNDHEYTSFRYVSLQVWMIVSTSSLQSWSNDLLWPSKWPTF